MSQKSKSDEGDDPDPLYLSDDDPAAQPAASMRSASSTPRSSASSTQPAVTPAGSPSLGAAAISAAAAAAAPAAAASTHKARRPPPPSEMLAKGAALLRTLPSGRSVLAASASSAAAKPEAKSLPTEELRQHIIFASDPGIRAQLLTGFVGFSRLEAFKIQWLRENYGVNFSLDEQFLRKDQESFLKSDPNRDQLRANRGLILQLSSDSIDILRCMLDVIFYNGKREESEVDARIRSKIFHVTDAEAHVIRALLASVDRGALEKLVPPIPESFWEADRLIEAKSAVFEKTVKRLMREIGSSADAAESDVQNLSQIVSKKASASVPSFWAINEAWNRVFMGLLSMASITVRQILLFDSAEEKATWDDTEAAFRMLPARLKGTLCVPFVRQNKANEKLINLDLWAQEWSDATEGLMYSKQDDLLIPAFVIRHTDYFDAYSDANPKHKRLQDFARAATDPRGAIVSREPSRAPASSKSREASELEASALRGMSLELKRSIEEADSWKKRFDELQAAYTQRSTKLIDDLRTKDTEITQLRASVDSNAGATKSLQDALLGKEEEIVSLKAASATNAAVAKGLQSELDAAGAEITALKARSSSSGATMSSLQSEISELERVLATEQARGTELWTKHTEVLAQLTSERDVISRLRAELATKISELATIRASATAKDAGIQAANEQSRAIEKELSATKIEIARLSSEVQSVHKDREETYKIVEQLRAMLRNKDDDIKRVISERDNATEAINSLRAQFDAKEKQLARELKAKDDLRDRELKAKDDLRDRELAEVTRKAEQKTNEILQKWKADASVSGSAEKQLRVKAEATQQTLEAKLTAAAQAYARLAEETNKVRTEGQAKLDFTSAQLLNANATIASLRAQLAVEQQRNQQLIQGSAGFQRRLLAAPPPAAVAPYAPAAAAAAAPPSAALVGLQASAYGLAPAHSSAPPNPNPYAGLAASGAAAAAARAAAAASKMEIVEKHHDTANVIAETAKKLILSSNNNALTDLVKGAFTDFADTLQYNSEKDFLSKIVEISGDPKNAHAFNAIVDLSFQEPSKYKAGIEKAMDEYRPNIPDHIIKGAYLTFFFAYIPRMCGAQIDDAKQQQTWAHALIFSLKMESGASLPEYISPQKVAEEKTEIMLLRLSKFRALRDAWYRASNINERSNVISNASNAWANVLTAVKRYKSDPKNGGARWIFGRL